MKNQKASMYDIVKKYYGSVLAYEGYTDDDTYLKDFFELNFPDCTLMGEDTLCRNPYVKDESTGKTMFGNYEGNLILLPISDDEIRVGNHLFGLILGRRLKCIRINDKGLFIEKHFFQGGTVGIDTFYYDNDALESIAERGVNVLSLECLESMISELEVMPTAVMTVTRNKDNGEVYANYRPTYVEKYSFPITPTNSLYKGYFEYMKKSKLFGEEFNKSGVKLQQEKDDQE